MATPKRLDELEEDPEAGEEYATAQDDAFANRRPSMASPIPGGNEGVERYKVTDEDFESLQNFDWSRTRPEILNDLEFIARLPKEPGLDYESIGPSLPPKDLASPKKSLFIDLDETIAHTALGNLPHTRTPDLVFHSVSDGSTANVYFRPWVDDFLRVVSQYYEIILYTASVKPYADLIVDELDVDNRISHRLYREHCTQYGSTDIYFKDINGTGRDLKDSIVIDNRLISFGLNVDNGIFVSSFLGQSDDAELLQLIPLLIALSKQPDVRVSLSQTYRLPEIIEKFQIDSRATSPGSGISDDAAPTPSPRLSSTDLSLSLLNMGSPAAHMLPGVEKLEIHATATAMIGSRVPMRARTPNDSEFQASSETDEEMSREEMEDLTPSPTPLETIQEPLTETCGDSSAGDEEAVTRDSARQAVETETAELMPSRERRHSPQRSGSRHLAALSKLSAALPPEEPKESKALGSLEHPAETPSLRRERQVSGSWRRIILPLEPPSRQRRRGKDRALLELARLMRPQKLATETPRAAEETPSPPPTPVVASPLSARPALAATRLVTPPHLAHNASHTSLSTGGASPYRTFTAGSRSEYMTANAAQEPSRLPAETRGAETPFPRLTYFASPSQPEVYTTRMTATSWAPLVVGPPQVMHYSPLVSPTGAPPSPSPPLISSPSPSYVYTKTAPFMW